LMNCSLAGQTTLRRGSDIFGLRVPTLIIDP
jgi:hypothetical protein